MSETRYSLWQVVGLVVVVLALCAASLLAGVYLGYQWGKARGTATALLETRGPEEAPVRPPTLQLPRDLEPPFSPFSERPYLGVYSETITPELAEAESLPVQEGAILREVAPDSPAEEAGLEPGDIILRVDQEPVNQVHSLRDRILAHRPGDQISLTVIRGDSRLSLEVTLGEQPAFGPFEFPFFSQESLPGFRFWIDCWPEPCPFFDD
jgi:membrane-associated protease RseP (regulator of RpoE activity)